MSMLILRGLILLAVDVLLLLSKSDGNCTENSFSSGDFTIDITLLTNNTHTLAPFPHRPFSCQNE